MHPSLLFLVSALLAVAVVATGEGGVEAQWLRNVNATTTTTTSNSTSVQSTDVGSSNMTTMTTVNETSTTTNTTINGNSTATAANMTPPATTPTTLSPSIAPNDDYTLTDDDTIPLVDVPPRQDCYTDLDDLVAIVKAKDPFIKDTFILCPNTVFDIGYSNSDGRCCTNGMHPLWTRKDTTYQCGHSGSSTNNCTLRGGSVQLLAYGWNFNGEAQPNVVIQGITFENAADFASAMIVEGDFSFIDCIFKNHKNLGTIRLAYPGPEEENRLQRHLDRHDLSSFYRNVGYNYRESMAYNVREMNQQHNNNNNSVGRRRRHRRSQTTDDETIVVRHSITFDNCLFFNNSVGPTGDPRTQNGVIFSETGFNDVVINNSIFLDNIFDNSEVPGDSFAVYVKFGSTLEIYDTCFINNNFVGRGSVLVDDGVYYKTNGNYGTNNDLDLNCPFLSVGNATCVDYESALCLAPKYTTLALLTKGYNLATNGTSSNDSSSMANGNRTATSGSFATVALWGWASLLLVLCMV